MKRKHLEIIAGVGNKIAQEFYEANINSQEYINSEPMNRQTAVYKKYLEKLYAPANTSEPIKKVLENINNGMSYIDLLFSEQ